MPAVLRIIDANANRAREALRVMEESARFLLDDDELCAALKQLRHDLAAALAALPGLEASRDTPGDVGTRVSTAREEMRDGAGAVAIAAGKRLSEALRSIEEYSKVLGDTGRALPGLVEQMRYHGYELEQRLVAALATGRARQWRLCVLISESLCRDGDWQAVARGAIEGGADCLQLREKSLDARPLLDRARALVALARPRGVSVIVNDRLDVALAAGADGVHLGQGDLPVAEARKIVGRQLLIGVSTSCLDEARRAKRDGADYCGVGPMFNTTTKHKDVIVGPAYLREYLAWGGLPHLAIGGIGVDNIDALVEAGAKGVAVSSAVCAAADAAKAARQLATAWKTAPRP